MDFISAAIMLFLIMDPIGNIPMFHIFLQGMTPEQRRKVMIRELLFAYLFLSLFLLAGQSILGYLGISQSSLSITGGVILFLIAINMVFPRQGIRVYEEEKDPFIVPLAVPFIAGPSAIAVELLLVSKHPDFLWHWMGAMTLAWVGSSALILGSNYLMRFVGHRGLRAMEKLMGMLLIMMAIQMLLDGVKSYWVGLQQAP